MRVIVSAGYGTLGDVAPLLSIAETLAQQGHRVTIVVDGFFLPMASAVSGITVLTIGSAEAYAAALADPAARWRKPQVLVQTWLSRLKQHYEARLLLSTVWHRACASPAAQLFFRAVQILKRLLADAPADTVFVGHSLDLAVKLIEASTVRCL
jgi:hypothetical protein